MNSTLKIVGEASNPVMLTLFAVIYTLHLFTYTHVNRRVESRTQNTGKKRELDVIRWRKFYANNNMQ